MNSRIATRTLRLVALAMLFECAGALAVEPVRTHVNGVDLSYIEQGSGAPVILLHGGMGDYSSWQPQLDSFARGFRVIAYSRRYSFPQLARSTAEGEAAYRDFMGTVMTPAASSFRNGDVECAMRVFVNGMAATNRFDSLSSEARGDAIRNSRSIEALSLSANPFPAISRTALSQLRIPALVVTGENTIRLHKLVNRELISLLPNVKGVTIEGAGHGSPRYSVSSWLMSEPTDEPPPLAGLKRPQAFFSTGTIVSSTRRFC